MSNDIEATNSRWYKEPWAWIILGILLVSILHGLSLLFAGLKFGDTLVVDNYYDAGVGINKSLEREALAKSLNIKGTLTFDNERNEVQLVLDGNFSQLPPYLTLNVISPTIAELDRQIILQPKSGNNVYTGTTDGSLKDRRLIEVLGQENGQDWRLFEEETLAVGQAVHLGDE